MGAANVPGGTTLPQGFLRGALGEPLQDAAVRWVARDPARVAQAPELPFQLPQLRHALGDVAEVIA